MEHIVCSTLFSLLYLHSCTYMYVLIVHVATAFYRYTNCTIYQETFEGENVCGSV